MLLRHHRMLVMSGVSRASFRRAWWWHGAEVSKLADLNCARSYLIRFPLRIRTMEALVASLRSRASVSHVCLGSGGMSEAPVCNSLCALPSSSWTADHVTVLMDESQSMGLEAPRPALALPNMRSTLRPSHARIQRRASQNGQNCGGSQDHSAAHRHCPCLDAIRLRHDPGSFIQLCRTASALA